MTDTDILSGIHEAARAHPAWESLALDSPLPAPPPDLIAAFERHFGVRFTPGDMAALTTVTELVTLLRQKFRAD